MIVAKQISGGGATNAADAAKKMTGDAVQADSSTFRLLVEMLSEIEAPLPNQSAEAGGESADVVSEKIPNEEDKRGRLDRSANFADWLLANAAKVKEVIPALFAGASGLGDVPQPKAIEGPAREPDVNEVTPAFEVTPAMLAVASGLGYVPQGEQSPLWMSRQSVDSASSNAVNGAANAEAVMAMFLAGAALSQQPESLSGSNAFDRNLVLTKLRTGLQAAVEAASDRGVLAEMPAALGLEQVKLTPGLVSDVLHAGRQSEVPTSSAELGVTDVALHQTFAQHLQSVSGSEALEREREQRQSIEAIDHLLLSSYQRSALSQDLAAGDNSFDRLVARNETALQGSVSWLASNHGGVAKLDLSPPDLGELRLELSMSAKGDRAELIVVASSPDAKLVVERSISQLVDRFLAGGVALNVSFGTGSGQSSARNYESRSANIDPNQGRGTRRSDTEVSIVTGLSRTSNALNADKLSFYA
ncbi:MAG: flagellar hook-length control protein FliK [Betaproteobacteria bacterium]|nr:flagellar hook-length control protein FliK [Betaproteobacteria bacterium]